MKMKFIIFLLLVIFILSCKLISLENSVTIKLNPTDEGYDIYCEDGELLLEFTENNDKEEIKLLKYIYDVSLEHREELKKEFEK